MCKGGTAQLSNRLPIRAQREADPSMHQCYAIDFRLVPLSEAGAESADSRSDQEMPLRERVLGQDSRS